MRRMSHPQTLTTKWTAEKCLDKRVQSKQTHMQTQARQPNKQMVESESRRSVPK